MLIAAGQLVMCRHLAANGVWHVRMHDLQGLGDATMQQTPPRGAQTAVGHLAQLIVGKVVRLNALTRSIADDAALPQFVQAADQPVFILVAHPGQHRQCKLAADGRRLLGQLAGRSGELGQPGMQDAMHAGGQRK